MSRMTRRQSNPGFGPPVGPGAPIQKAKDFKGTLKRLIRYLAPYKFRLLTVLLAAILSTVFTIVGPKVLGKATTKIFEGIMEKMSGISGAGIDFEYIIRILFLLGGLYLFSSLFAFIQQYIMASVAQNTVFTLREEAEAKVSRLPLKYFDGTTTGETLSRIVNDIDNMSIKWGTTEDKKEIASDTLGKDTAGEVNNINGAKDNVSVGDTVNYKITAKVPANADKYNYFYFVVNDTLDKGLTFTEGSIKVYKGSVA